MANKSQAGSQIDFQIAVAKHIALDSIIIALKEDWKDGKVIWYSPIAEASFREFHDNSFWDGRFNKSSKCFWNGIGEPKDIKEFWPKGGPFWDGLAVVERKDGNKTLVLFEAKAHKRELISDCRAKDPDSIKKISKQFRLIQEESGLNNDVDWMKTYYQFANRLAYYLFLKSKGIDIALVYVLFANDPYWNTKDFTGVDEWYVAIAKERKYFGIDKYFQKENCIYDLVIDLNSNQYKDILNEIRIRIECLK